MYVFLKLNIYKDNDLFVKYIKGQFHMFQIIFNSIKSYCELVWYFVRYFQGYPALQGYMAPGYYQQYAATYSTPQAAAAGKYVFLLCSV